MQSESEWTNEEPLTTVTPGGDVVLAKLYAGRPTPKTFANRTQAVAAQKKCGDDWEVMARGSMGWKVRKKLWCETDGCDAYARLCACGNAHCKDHPHE